MLRMLNNTSFGIFLSVVAAVMEEYMVGDSPFQLVEGYSQELLRV